MKVGFSAPTNVVPRYSTGLVGLGSTGPAFDLRCPGSLDVSRVLRCGVVKAREEFSRDVGALVQR